MTIKANFSCTYTFFFVPLQRKAEQSVCRHNKRRLLALVLELLNPAKFIHPKQESDKCPLVC